MFLSLKYWCTEHQYIIPAYPIPPTTTWWKKNDSSYLFKCLGAVFFECTLLMKWHKATHTVLFSTFNAHLQAWIRQSNFTHKYIQIMSWQFAGIHLLWVDTNCESEASTHLLCPRTRHSALGQTVWTQTAWAGVQKVNIGRHISYMKQIKPYSNAAQLMPNLNVELSKAEERYMNQLGSAV